MPDWDEDKRQTNLAKHGVDFDAIAAFDWTTATVEPDARRDYAEMRWIALGKIGDRLHYLAFTRRGADTRIISLRKANRRERRRWESLRP
ncbi:MAG: BrnT family toxin [Gemmobacter sp.]